MRDGIDDASVVVIQDVDDDAFVTFVATLPDRRGERLASAILAHALHEAERRGKQTTSLQASKLGQSIYARLGYRPLGEIHLYERRPYLTPRCRTPSTALAAGSRPTSPTRARSPARTAATAPTTTRSRWRRRSP